MTTHGNAPKLRDELRKLLALLEGVKERFWSEKVRRVLEKEPTDPREVLSWFGGMGSLNDLIISPLNDHVERPEREGLVNQQLDDVRSSLYRLALTMREP